MENLLSQAQQWTDVGTAYAPPDKRLLVLWCEFEEPDVVTETKHLYRLAVDFAERMGD